MNAKRAEPNQLRRNVTETAKLSARPTNECRRAGPAIRRPQAQQFDGHRLINPTATGPDSRRFTMLRSVAAKRKACVSLICDLRLCFSICPFVKKSQTNRQLKYRRALVFCGSHVGSSTFSAVDIVLDCHSLSNPTATGPAIRRPQAQQHDSHRLSNPTIRRPGTFELLFKILFLVLYLYGSGLSSMIDSHLTLEIVSVSELPKETHDGTTMD